MMVLILSQYFLHQSLCEGLSLLKPRQLLRNRQRILCTYDEPDGKMPHYKD